MAVDVEIIPVGTDDLQAVLDGWARRVLTLAEAYGGIVTDFHHVEAERFSAEGPGWQPLAPSTQADRRRKGYGAEHPILHRTGELQDSLTSLDAAGSVFRVEPEGFFVGTNIEHAHWHQSGGSVAGRPPQRKLVDLTVADEVRWMAMLGRYLAHGAVGEVEVVVSSSAGPGGPRSAGPG